MVTFISFLQSFLVFSVRFAVSQGWVKVACFQSAKEIGTCKWVPVLVLVLINFDPFTRAGKTKNQTDLTDMSK